MTMNNTSTAEFCLFSVIKDSPHTFGIQFTAIATSVIGILSSFGSILGNALVLFVLMKHARLQIPSNLLLGNLCITDFITGLIVVPTISARRITEAYGKGICILRVTCAYFSYLTIMVSVFTVGVISIDRYYAIMKPFHYQRIINNKQYIIIIMLVACPRCLFHFAHTRHPIWFTLLQNRLCVDDSSNPCVCSLLCKNI